MAAVAHSFGGIGLSRGRVKLWQLAVGVLPFYESRIEHDFRPQRVSSGFRRVGTNPRLTTRTPFQQQYSKLRAAPFAPVDPKHLGYKHPGAPGFIRGEIKNLYPINKPRIYPWRNKKPVSDETCPPEFIRGVNASI
jgi:hypothetical protein